MNFLGKELELMEVPYKILKEALDKKYLWKNNYRCPGCGRFIYGQIPDIRSCETGFSYCSKECCQKYINENYQEEENDFKKI